MLFSSFAISNDEVKSRLYDFSQIFYRHLKWFSNELKKQNIEYNYDKDDIQIQKNTSFEYFKYLIEEIKVSLDYLETKEALYIKKIYLTGGLGLFSGINRELENLLGVEVKNLEVLKFYKYEEKISTLQNLENNFSIALGLAL